MDFWQSLTTRVVRDSVCEPLYNKRTRMFQAMAVDFHNHQDQKPDSLAKIRQVLCYLGHWNWTKSKLDGSSHQGPQGLQPCDHFVTVLWWSVMILWRFVTPDHAVMQRNYSAACKGHALRCVAPELANRPPADSTQHHWWTCQLCGHQLHHPTRLTCRCQPHNSMAEYFRHAATGLPCWWNNSTMLQ